MQAQLIDATLARSLLAGVWNPKVFLGRSRMGRFAELRGELRWQLLFNGAKDGKPQCTIPAVFEGKKEILD